MTPPREIPRSDDLTPGRWGIVDLGDKQHCIAVACPKCGGVSTLQKPPEYGAQNHAIDATGVVTPSAVCPFEPCDWHEWIRLRGWDSRLSPGGRTT